MPMMTLSAVMLKHSNNFSSLSQPSFKFYEGNTFRPSFTNIIKDCHVMISIGNINACIMHNQHSTVRGSQVKGYALLVIEI